MNIKSFDEFKRKYKDRIEEDEVINMLLKTKTRNYIIENDDYDFLALIASCNDDELRKFYFNDETIPYIIKLNKFSGILHRKNFFPNKIKLFDNEIFLKGLTIKNNTKYLMVQLKQEIEKNCNNKELVDSLKNALHKYMDYLKKEFENNLESISIFMKEIHADLYNEFLEDILNDLRRTAILNKDSSFNEFFDNTYIKYNNKEFKSIENIINKFKTIDNLYYSKSLVHSLIQKSVNYNGNIIISNEELSRLHDYIFNEKAKKNFLENFEYDSFKKLYYCFKNEIISYFFDEDGLITLDKNDNFDKLFSLNIPCDNLTKSNIFATILAKKYPKSEDFDEKIRKLYQNLNDDESIYELLDRYIEINDYNHFFRIFINLSSTKQLVYFKNNLEKLSELKDSNIHKGMKKELYEIYKDKLDIKDWIFSDYDLTIILENIDDYSSEQLEQIYSNIKNISIIANGIYSKYTYKLILNLNNPKLNQIYMSEEYISVIRKLNKLDCIYEILDEITTDITPLMLNKTSLTDIGEEVIKEDKMNRIREYEHLPSLVGSNKYFWFLLKTPRLKDKDLLFNILDFYLTNDKYLSTFHILKKGLNHEVLEEYFTSRKNLITKVVQENESSNVSFVFNGVPDEIIIKDFVKERENMVLYCNHMEYHKLFHEHFKGKYKLSNEILSDDQFIVKFLNFYGNLEEELKLVCNDKKIVKGLIDKIKSTKQMQSTILEGLNDSKQEFKTYIEILINSGIDVYQIEFLKDMIDIVFFNRQIKEVFSKYKGLDLEVEKLNILSNIIKSSRENIVQSITNPLDKEVVYLEYLLDDKKVLIPTIIYDEDNYTFLVRRMQTGNHIHDENYKEKLEYYSTITEKNRSVYYGDSGVKFGYIKVNPEDIIQINSIDAISQNSSSNKYCAPYLKYSEWVTMEELNKRTFNNRSYNEIRIYGKYIPDFTISYDEPNEKTLRYSHENNTPMVKILRKNYPNAIEECRDIYSHWQ